MTSRNTVAALAAMAILVGTMFVAGCSEKLPPPTVDNSQSEATKSVEPTLGVDAPLTVKELRDKLDAKGITTTDFGTSVKGVFLTSKYSPFRANGALVQTYRFKNRNEAKGAASTVDAEGFVLAPTPSQTANVPWDGWPAFFRSGDMIVIFVTRKGKAADPARDTAVYKALTSILGPPFIGGPTPPAAYQHALNATGSANPTGSASATGSAPATSSGP